MFDIYGIGNALVDFEIKVSDDFLSDHKLTKGQMYLKSAVEIEEIRAGLNGPDFMMSSGGSAANTIFGASGFGLKTAYCGRVRDDENGLFFIDEMRAAGIHVDRMRSSKSLKEDTGNCLVLVTEDAQRTMCTNLGISSKLNSADINFETLKNSRFLYIEGYLAASESGAQAAEEAIKFAHNQGVRVLLTLSDVSMVNLFRGNIENFCENRISTLFCNEEEALCWAKTDRLEIALIQLRDISESIHITLGSEGSLILGPEGDPKKIAGVQTQALDTNGAGDMYAAAAISMIAKGLDLETAARFGNYAAASAVSQYGARLKSRDEYQAVFERF